MLKLLKWFIGLFSSYVDPFERKVDRFFKHIKSTDSLADIRDGLLELMQQNLAVVNLWMEKKYKGYTFLSKKKRRILYENQKKILAKFALFCDSNKPNLEELRILTTNLGVKILPVYEEKLLYLFQIMLFLEPGKYYNYVESSSFWKLFADIDTEKMEGDCNQIVTFYIYFYSLRFSIEDLNIKLLPEHVCLHFKGLDIEATNASFQNYKDDSQILPVTEIISTNLLDVIDKREATMSISPRDLVKSAQLAYAISSHKAVVEKNLQIAYKNLSIASMESGDFDSALFFADKAGDSELKNTIKHNQGVHYFQSGQYDKALSVFSSLGDDKMQKACYMQKYNLLVKKVGHVKTLQEAKRYKSTYSEMLSLAQKVGDAILVSAVKDTLGKI